MYSCRAWILWLATDDRRRTQTLYSKSKWGSLQRFQAGEMREKNRSQVVVGLYTTRFALAFFFGCFSRQNFIWPFIQNFCRAFPLHACNRSSMFSMVLRGLNHKMTLLILLLNNNTIYELCVSLYLFLLPHYHAQHWISTLWQLVWLFSHPY